MIKLSYDVKKYRRDLLELVEADDTVIELGCHVGGTTKLIAPECRVIAVDNSPEAIDEMKNIENVEFIPGDVRRHEIIAEAYKIVQSCDLLAVDLGGRLVLAMRTIAQVQVILKAIMIRAFLH